jgi:uncharacterized iron-regulated membrane protein
MMDSTQVMQQHQQQHEQQAAQQRQIPMTGGLVGLGGMDDQPKRKQVKNACSKSVQKTFT